MRLFNSLTHSLRAGPCLAAVLMAAGGMQTVGAPVATIELTCVDPEATGYGTFQSHNQKVVANRRGIFMTHIRTRNEAYTAQQWRLSWSRDGGKTFETLYEATHATNPPLLETDADDNLYLIRSLRFAEWASGAGSAARLQGHGD